RPLWVNMFSQNKNYLANEDKKANLLLGSVATKREALYIGFIAEDPTASKYSEPALSSDEFNMMKANIAVQKFLAQHKEMGKEVESEKAQAEKPTPLPESSDVTHIIKTLPGKMAFDLAELPVKAAQQVHLLFENNAQMPHNIVFAKPGSKEKVGKA